MTIFDPQQNRHPFNRSPKICHMWLRARLLPPYQIWCTSVHAGFLGELVKYNYFYRQHCAQRNAPLFELLRGRFSGFSPRRGDTTLHRGGWHLARNLLHAKFHPTVQQ